MSDKTVGTARRHIQETSYSAKNNIFMTAISFPIRTEIISKHVNKLHPEITPTLT